MGLKVNQQHNLEQLFDKFATIDPKNRKETKTVEKESNKTKIIVKYFKISNFWIADFLLFTIKNENNLLFKLFSFYIRILSPVRGSNP